MIFLWRGGLVFIFFGHKGPKYGFLKFEKECVELNVSYILDELTVAYKLQIELINFWKINCSEVYGPQLARNSPKMRFKI